MNLARAADLRALAGLRGIGDFDAIGLADIFRAAARDASFAAAVQRHTKSLQSGVDDDAAMTWAGVLRQMSKKWASKDAVDIPSTAPELLHLWQKRPSAVKVTEKVKSVKSAKRVHEKLHVYSSGAALCVELDDLRTEGPLGALKSLTLEFAKASSGGNGAKEYDWERKIAFQLTRKELPIFLAVLMGWSSSWEAKGHGVEHDKSLSVRAQESGLLFTLRRGGTVVLVPAPGAELYGLVALALKALLLNDPHLSSQCVLAMCKSGAVWGRRGGA